MLTGRRRIIEASSDIFERQSLQKLGCGVFEPAHLHPATQEGRCALAGLRADRFGDKGRVRGPGRHRGVQQISESPSIRFRAKWCTGPRPGQDAASWLLLRGVITDVLHFEQESFHTAQISITQQKLCSQSDGYSLISIRKAMIFINRHIATTVPSCRKTSTVSGLAVPPTDIACSSVVPRIL